GVPTGDEQPRLSESGWQNQIASIQVQSGTWDFYSEENFGGEAMRLTPGPYAALAPEWTKRIGSVMCGPPGGGPSPHTPNRHAPRKRGLCASCAATERLSR